MNVAITVISAVLVFGFLIFIHEFGHYITARIFKVTIEEFSIGMGPRLMWYESKRSKIKYSLAMLPIGGFVAMPGEDGESDEYKDDPNTFDKKPAYQRLIIVVAGALVNIIIGFIFVLLLTSMIKIGSTTVASFSEDERYEISSAECGIEVGDEIIKIDGKRVDILDELSYEIMRRGNEPVDVTVIRDGREITLYDVKFPTTEESGQTFGVMDFKVYEKEKSFGNVMSFSWQKSTLIVRMCFESLIDLIRGRYSFAAVSGPVGISSAIGEAVNMGFTSLLYMVALISINLGVMNLLPLPALDGGRMIMLLIEMITRKKLPAKVEGIINATGLMLLLGLSAVIMVKDIFTLVG